MSEEEIIKQFEHWIEYEKQHKDKINKADELIEIQQGLLDLYNKEKEKRWYEQELRTKYELRYDRLKEKITEDYISKDKIREKIKYYEQKKKDLLGLPDDCAKMIASEDCDEKIYIYKELLEE